MSKDDVEQHQFTYEEICSVKRVIDGVAKIMQLETTLRDRALTWYMKYNATMPVGQGRSLAKIKQYLLRDF